MTVFTSSTAPIAGGRGRSRGLALLMLLVLTLSACSLVESGDAATEVGPKGTKSVGEMSDEGTDADDDSTEEGEDGSTDVTAPEGDGVENPDTADPDETTTTIPDDARPPGTVNDLDDLIGNENEQGLDSQGSDSRIERFVASLLADTGGLEVSESEARCAAMMLDERLSATSFELLVTNLETINEIEDGTQFTDAELVVISESLANCLDFRILVDEVSEDQASLGMLVDCLVVEVGVDGVEALFLFEVIGDDSDRITSRLILVGFDVCPVEARAAVDEEILNEFLLADAPAIEACLAEVSNAELRPYFDTREFSELIVQLREQCLF